MADPEEDPECQAQPSNLSTTQLFAMCLCILTEAAQVTMPYTVAVYMVRQYLGDGAPQPQISKLTGILAAIFMSAQFLTSYPWGLFSDIYGRKPLVVLGNACTTLAILLFGLAPSYLLACAARFLGGFFNCSYMNIRAMIGESTDAATQGVVMGYVSLAWGLGTVLGPVMGGALTHPCRSSWFRILCQPGQLFDERPFLLPCVALAVVSGLATCCSLFWLKETLPRLASRHASSPVIDDALVPFKAANDLVDGEVANGGGLLHTAGDPGERLLRVPHRGPGSLLGVHPVQAEAASRGPASDPRHIPSTPAENMPGLEMGSPSALVCHLSRSVERRLAGGSPSLPLRSPFTTRWSFHGSQSLNGGGFSALESPRPSHDGLGHRRSSSSWDVLSSAEGAWEHRRPPVTTGQPALTTPLLPDAASLSSPDIQKPWWRNSQVVRTVVGYGSVCFLYNLLDELVPIYAASPLDSGGLDLSAAQLSTPLSTAGVFLMGWALVGYPRMQAWLGPTGMILFGLLFTAPMSMAIPASSLFATREVAAKVALTVALCLKNVGANNSFSSSSILVNLLAPVSQVGAINGASQTLASFVRAVGPALGGYVWAFSLSWGFGHQYAPFAMASIVAIAGSFLYVGLKVPSGA